MRGNFIPSFRNDYETQELLFVGQATPEATLVRFRPLRSCLAKR